MARKSLLDTIRNKNYLRRSFTNGNSEQEMTREMYIEYLKTEIQQWRDLLKEKGKLAKSKPTELCIRKEDLKDLPKEYVEFLEGRPDYGSIIKGAEKFIVNLQCYNKLEHCMKDQCEKILDNLALEKDAIVKKLIDESKQLCLICNNNYCTVEIHPLIERATSAYPALISDLSGLQLNGSDV